MACFTGGIVRISDYSHLVLAGKVLDVPIARW